MPQYASALGTCVKCRRDKVQVEGGDVKCIFCDYDLNEPKGPTVNIPDPGEDEINKVLRATGVRVATGESTPSTPRPAKTAVAPQVSAPAVRAQIIAVISFEEGIQSALETLRALPMPKDLKQFKVVAKTIKSLESLLGA